MWYGVGNGSLKVECGGGEGYSEDEKKDENYDYI